MRAQHSAEPIYVGRPWIGRARAVILYRAWLADELGPAVLRAAHFDHDEISALNRWRSGPMRRIGELRGRQLRCRCSSERDGCHKHALAQAACAARAA